MIRALFALTLSAAAGFTLACLLAATPAPAEGVALYQLIATDSHGQTYVAGSGDDCRTAWEGAVLPADWRDIVCVEVSR